MAFTIIFAIKNMGEYIVSLLNEIPLYLFIGLLSLTFLCLIFAIIINGLEEGIKKTSLIVLVVYVIIILCSTVGYRIDGSAYGYKLIPFWSYVSIINGAPRLLEENIMNIIAFVPIGFLLKFKYRTINWWQVGIIGCCLSLVIELLQLYLNRGLCEIDDVMHNTTGSIIGYGIVKASFLKNE